MLPRSLFWSFDFGTVAVEQLIQALNQTKGETEREREGELHCNSLPSTFPSTVTKAARRSHGPPFFERKPS